MRLGDREESENVEDERGFGPQQAGVAISGGGLVLALVLMAFGVINPQQALHLAVHPQQAPANRQGGPPRQVDPEEDKEAHFTKVVFGDTERIWGELFQKAGKEYPKPTLHLFRGSVRSACGNADAAVGPFYCPGDSKVYIDLAFYKDMQNKLHAPGDFARAYVVAHEVGHHVQKLMGYTRFTDQARETGDKREINRASVRLELQADYLAGVWAYYNEKKNHFLDPGDIDSALNAAFEIGDDRLEKKARGYVVPDSFTHGTSKQRVSWFKRGFETGDIKAARELFDREYDDL
jgi:predicted metalloprotease